MSSKTHYSIFFSRRSIHECVLYIRRIFQFGKAGWQFPPKISIQNSGFQFEPILLVNWNRFLFNDFALTTCKTFNLFWNCTTLFILSFINNKV